jgi:osmotically-inducible protein OsmY
MQDSVCRNDFPLKLLCRLAFCLCLFLNGLPAFSQPVPQLPQGSTADQNAPNTKPVHDQMSSKDVTEKLRKAFDSKNVAYAGSKIDAAADDQSVTLTGTVTSSMQREMALQLARAYAGNRRVIDKLTIQ